MTKNRLGIVRGLRCWFAFVVSLSVGSNCYAQLTSTKLMTLTKSEGKIELHIGGKKQTIVATQYTGRTDERTIFSDRGFFIKNKRGLNEILSQYMYAPPPIDFAKDLVVYHHSRDKQCIKITVDLIGIKKGELEGLVPNEITKDGAEKENKLAFVLIILPKAAFK